MSPERQLHLLLQNPNLTPQDRSAIELAFEMANEAHKGQKRRSGEDYITHPLSVATFLAELGVDSSTIIAALLHDTVEDTNLTLEKIRKTFGTEVAFLVDGVTKLTNLGISQRQRNVTKTDLHVSSLKKMFFAVAEDIRVILIKLSDRYHNMQTLRFQPEEAQFRVAQETLDIYAPIAGRLGMGKLKGDLEDLAFPYVHPVAWHKLTKEVKEKYADRLKYTDRAKPIIAHHLQEANISVTSIHSRAKHYYSLYQKLQRYEQDLDKVFDLVAMRVIVPDVRSCYEALGVIHKHYRPLPGRIKDYIAVPKPNGYRSLHTTIFGEKGKIIEVQIRTQDMHDHAENGIAAHWAYTESGKRAIQADQKEVQWINQLKDVLKNIKTAEGLKNIKIDFFKNRIFVFTPQGDIKDLPEGATPIDFAYSIHTDLGHTTVGARINGKLVTLSQELMNGDVVEILKTKKPHPSRDWLRFVKTTEAKKRIKSWLASQETVAVEIAEAETPIKKYVPRVSSPNRTKKKLQTLEKRLYIEGQHGMLYKIAKCCSPTHEDMVKGYLTRGKGVTIHLTSCGNIKNADNKRLLSAHWK